MRKFFLLISAMGLLALGCGDGNGGGGDSGPGPVDGGLDAQVDLDGGDDGGGSPLDAAPGDDGGGTDTDGGAGADDGGSVTDGATIGSDAGCPAPLCPAPPPGCNYVGATACSCGTLECPDSTCDHCAPDEHCSTPDGMCGGTGTCTPTPDLCPGVYRPVCGCDGMTYGNACEAHAAGQSVAFDGPCPEPADCRMTGCGPGETCQACRGAGGVVHVCLPDGVVC